MTRTDTLVDSGRILVLTSLVSVLLSVLWIFLADKWDVLADGKHYMMMYHGEVARSPFGYRVLTPFLASLLPFDAMTSFAVVTLSSLALTSGVLMLYAESAKLPGSARMAVFLFWVTSFPYLYYGTTFVRADGLMFLTIALVILLSRFKVSSLVLMVLLSIGTLAHEMVMIVIPALWLDRVFSGTLTGGRHYDYRQLLLITIGTLSFYVLTRLVVQTSESPEPTYLKSPVEMFFYALEYSGGAVKHILRVYASFGPIFLFSLFYVVFVRRNARDALVYFGLLVTVFAATFLATDTLRVMAIFFLPVMTYAGYFIYFAGSKGSRMVPIFMVLLQVLYSSIVYFNLRTFEGSLVMNVAAAIISIIALLVSVWVVRYTPSRHGEMPAEV
ncbi:MAG TPA: hypothetical protein ENJ43_00235 [Gammaproteobacteria bacterium]|nr:hypothetical protein [Gammaproteobacteria bacterium]